MKKNTLDTLLLAGAILLAPLQHSKAQETVELVFGETFPPLSVFFVVRAARKFSEVAGRNDRLKFTGLDLDTTVFSGVLRRGVGTCLPIVQLQRVVNWTENRVQRFENTFVSRHGM